VYFVRFNQLCHFTVTKLSVSFLLRFRAHFTGTPQ
jgi:hypothetical protein